MDTIREPVEDFGRDALEFVPEIVAAAIVFIVFAIASGLVRRALRRTFEGQGRANIGMVFGRLSQVGILIAGGLIAASIVFPSVGAAELLASLGFVSIAIGFAFRDILENFLAGLLLLIRQPFQAGDQIISGDHEGTVEAIETRSTVIRTYDGVRVLIPNAEIYTNPVVVNTAHEKRRNEYDVGVEYGSDLGAATEALLTAMKSVDGVAADPPPDVIAVDLADSSVNLRARWWSDTPQAEFLRVQDRVIKRFTEELDRIGVGIPFPTRLLIMDKGGD